MSIKRNFKTFIEEAKKQLYHEDEPVHKKILLWLGAGLAIVATTGLLLATLIVAVLSLTLPDVGNLDALIGAQSTIIYDREGNVLYTIHGEENRKPVDLTEIPLQVRQATIAIEDDNFYEHNGFDVGGIVKAFLNEAFGVGKKRGGSTITQQFVKNAFLSPERSYARKIKELILAVRLEREYEKDQILELYLNRIPYGNNAHGVQKAAKVYFNKDADELTLPEAVILASLPKAPSYYSPYGSHKYTTIAADITDETIRDRDIRDIADLREEEFMKGLLGKTYQFTNRNVYLPGRTDEVLKRMAELGMITEQEKNTAVQALSTIEIQEYREDITAPHFVFYVREILEEKYGKDVVESGGLQVHTTLDPEIQKVAEESIVASTAERGKLYEYNNMASVTMNVKNGHILSMVGSSDFFNDEIDGKVNIATSIRQPGSSFKPIVYAAAFLQGYAPATILFDIRTSFGGGDPPRNWDDEYWGPMSARYALAQSRNIPAIKAYYLAGGKDPIIDLAQRMGITTLDRRIEYGWPLGIGTGEVQLLELARAFGIFANGGISTNITPILKITDKDGNVLEEWDDEKDAAGKEVLDPQVAYLVTDILAHDEDKLGEFIKLTGRVAAAKTGTANKRTKVGDKSVNNGKGIVLPTNLWTVGYTPEIVTGVWAGNADGKEMVSKASGLWSAGPVWQKIMTKVGEKYTVNAFPVPEGVKHVKVSKRSGKLPGPGTPESDLVDEVFASFNVPTEKDDLYSSVQVVGEYDCLPNEFTPENMIENRTYANYHAELPIPAWEDAIRAWAGSGSGGEEDEENKNNGDGLLIGAPPTEICTQFTAQTMSSAPSIKIMSHQSGVKIPAGFLTVTATASTPNGLKHVEFFRGDEMHFRDQSAPFEGTIRIAKNTDPGTKFLIKAAITDMLGYTAMSVVEVEIE